MTAIPEPGPRWPDAVLAARDRLGPTPDVGVVTTSRLVLRPYTVDDAEELHAISDGTPVRRMGRSVDAYDAAALVWRFMFAGPFADPAGLHALHATFLDRPDAQPYTVVDTATGERVGSVSLMAHAPRDLRVEIGNVWYTPAVQGLGVNREVALALVDVLFSHGYQRVEWKCDARNLRSRHAAEAMGFAYEGTFRAHMVVRGRRRDTAWYARLPGDAPDAVGG